ncbi:MAG TPA: hypothetical protein IAA10_04960 [Candidatus Blautia intestinavium]|nr:hypothetical protein [Candidatus Blautia intestinavium]
MGKRVVSGIIRIAIYYLICTVVYAIGCLLSGEPIVFSWELELLIIVLTALLYLADIFWNRHRDKQR